MKVLVIGGSYFYGRVFVMLAAKEHDITVLNRGTYSMEEFGVRQIVGERHNAEILRSCGAGYDAVVDFCAYAPGDIRTVLENLPGRPGQYILISTVDVYRRTGIAGKAAREAGAEAWNPETGTYGESDSEGKNAGESRENIPGAGPDFKEENFPLEDRRFPGEAGAYIAGKTALERELRRECGVRGISFTVLRPAILYGPYNYAPRESVFIRLAVKEHVLPRFTDAAGRFQFVYVKDAADAVLKCLGNEKSFGQAYNLCGDETLDYDMFFRELAACAAENPEGAAAAGESGDRTKDGGTAMGESDDRTKGGGTAAGESDDRTKDDKAAREKARRDKGALREVPMTLAEAAERGIPIPFPATAGETELVSNRKSREELGMEYTPLHPGMLKTFRAFSRVYGE
ncbi:MAG: NAD-dependent epimerase/dehydratase family protein [bacterium]|nr:NAD-dependent epimerase/dehydratase family protein [bacterium]